METQYKRFGGHMFTWPAATLLLAVLLCVSLTLPARAETSSWRALQEEVRQAEDGDIITLYEDITAAADDGAISVGSGACVTLDLNGHTLNRNLEQLRAYGYVIFVQEGAVLTIRDSGNAGGGTITGGYHGKGGGIVNNGTLIMEGGRVTGNTAQESGGGIANYGTMVLLGGSVTGNTAMVGGGVYNQAKAHLTVRSGIVYGNIAPKESEISNDGKLTVVSTVPEQTRSEDMPVLRAFMAQISVLPAAAMVLVLLLTVCLDEYLSRARKKSMIVIIILVFGLILQNYLEYKFSQVRGTNSVKIPLAVFGYSVRPAILAMFLSVVKPGKRYYAAWAMIGVNAAVYMTAFFSDIAFGYTPDVFEPGAFVSGPLYYTCTAVSFILFAWLLFLSIQQFHPRKRSESWIPVIAAVLVVATVIMDMTAVFYEQPVTFLTFAIVISSVFYYIWLHLLFVREHEQGLFAEQRIETMMAQIQPHFLFNSLTAIRAAYRTDEEKGETALTAFSEYLRHNMDALTQERMIPLQKELQHVEHYLFLQKLRFGDKLQVRWELETTELRLPSLTLQPLVENAVTYGVRQTTTGTGTVTIRSQDCRDHFEITVTDDGPGLMTIGEAGDGDRSHIGLQNVRARLQLVCGGELRIRSEPGRGVVATIVLPKEQT